MARIPMVERVYGQDELARRHRLVGFSVVQPDARPRRADHARLRGLDAHERRSPSSGTLVVDYPGMLLAVAGTGAAGHGGVTSIRGGPVARLRYESWHLLHLYAYLGVGLALPAPAVDRPGVPEQPAGHRCTGGRCGSPPPRAILVCRLGLPVYRTLRHDLRVAAVVRESARGRLGLDDRPRPATGCRCGAGQFFIWRFLSRPGLDARPPVLAVRRADRRHPADHRQGPRRRQPRAGAAPAGHPGGHRGPVRPPARRRPDPAQGHPARQRHRHHPAAGAARGAAAGPRRRHADLPRPRRAGPRLPRRARALGCSDAVPGCVYVLGRRVPGRDSWLPQDAAHLSRRRGAAAAGARHRRPRRLHLRRRPSGWTRREAAALAAGVPADHIHDERFSW